MLRAGKYKCPYCNLAWDDRDPGVARSYPPGEPEKVRYWWIPEIGDLRTDPDAIFHPVCFAQHKGVPALVALVHKHDSIGRSRPKLTARVYGSRR
ncbi:hypothetical protein ACIA8G_18450 [Lentzea sp. NPDC051213]|uniref:hypothetical protein n=1 Tax=Lentzea sp. NPDC051213 TaxID=3364126 RepID=UPI0037AF4780